MSQKDPKAGDDVALHKLILADPDINRIMDRDAARARAEQVRRDVEADAMLAAAIAANRDTLRGMAPPDAEPPDAPPDAAAPKLKEPREIERVTARMPDAAPLPGPDTKIGIPPATKTEMRAASAALRLPGAQITQRDLGPRPPPVVVASQGAAAAPSSWRTRHGVAALASLTLVAAVLLMVFLFAKGASTGAETHASSASPTSAPPSVPSVPSASAEPVVSATPLASAAPSTLPTPPIALTPETASSAPPAASAKGPLKVRPPDKPKGPASPPPPPPTSIPVRPND